MAFSAHNLPSKSTFTPGYRLHFTLSQICTCAVLRIRLYRSEDRGAKTGKICDGMPEAKELLRLLGKTRSKKVMMYLRQPKSGNNDNNDV